MSSSKGVLLCACQNRMWFRLQLWADRNLSGSLHLPHLSLLSQKKKLMLLVDWLRLGHFFPYIAVTFLRSYIYQSCLKWFTATFCSYWSGFTWWIIHFITGFTKSNTNNPASWSTEATCIFTVPDALLLKHACMELNSWIISGYEIFSK